MPKLLPFLGWLSGLLLACGTLGTAVAQQPAPRYISPTDTDPTYYARKARLASTSPEVIRTAPVVVGNPAALPSCFEPTDSITPPANGGFTPLPRNDDNSVGPIALGFGFKLFGTTYTSCYINNNGNLTFTRALEAYSSEGFPNETPIVSAFWGDVDTRAPGSGRVWYKVYPDRLVVTWHRVNYYTNPASNTPLKNTFQLVIRANAGPTPPSPDVTFAYGDMQWTTGNASGFNNSTNTGGFGGVPATVGVNQGNGTNNYIQTGRFNQNNATPPQASYPAGTTVYSGVNWLDDRCIGYTIAPAGNLPPTATGFPANNVLTLTVGQTANLALQFSGPEVGQTVSVVPNLGTLCNASAPVGSGASPIVNFSVTGAACNLGSNTVSFVATDNGSPVASQTFNLTVVVTPSTGGQWTGAVSTVYTNPANWSNNTVPTATDDVVIPASAVRMPVLSSAVAAASLNVATGASFTFDASGEMTLTGALTANGPVQGPGAVRATGSSAQTFSGRSTIRLGELSVGAAGVVLGTTLQVQRVVALNGNLTSNGNLTLLSDAQGTAMVVNNGSAQVQGNVTVQRYLDPSLNGGLGYRHLSAPVQNTTLDDLAVAGQFTPVVNPAYNTAAVPGTVTPFPTVFAYDQARVTASGNPGATDFDLGWASPASTGTAMTPGVGYTVNLTGGLTLDFVGALNNGALGRAGLVRGSQTESGWHLLGNPYPAPLDWNATLTRATGLENAVYVFKSSGTYAGSYASYVNGVGAARYIGLGQAFFVRTASSATPGAMAFDNSTRLTSYQNVTVQRGTQPAERRPLLQLDLVNTAGAHDAAYAYFEQGASAGFDARFDAHKLAAGAVPYLALLPAGLTAPQSISGLPALAGAEVAVPLGVWVPQAGTYTLRAEQLLNLPAGTHAYLRDAQTGTLTDLRQQPSYSCWLPAATYLTTRFSVVFGPQRVLGTAPAALSQQVALYPNPARGLARLQLPASLRQPAAEATLLNALGQTVRRYALAGQGPEAELSLQGLVPGVYTLQLATPAGQVTKRLLVE